jgi:transposase
MSMTSTSTKDRWRIPEKLWAKMEALLPPRPKHPLGCHNPRVPDRDAMDGIFFVLRTGCQWNALDATGICSCASAYRRFREWLDAGVFHEFWRQGLLAYDEAKGIDGRRDDEGAAGRGKKPAPTQPIAPRAERNAACSPMARACPSGSRLTARIETTTC